MNRYLKSKNVLAVIFVMTFFLILFFQTDAHAKTDVEFILDFSGSMNKVSGGETQIATARSALINALGSIPAETLVALRVYGHRAPQTNKEESCKDTELLVPFKVSPLSTIQQAISSLTPKGYTPIAYSLLQSKNDFDLSREAEKVLILLSDGEETCGGDPIAVLKQLKAEGFKVKVHTVGFNVDANTRKQLQEISNYTGGKYFDAKGAAELQKALQEATQEAVLVDKKKTTYGAPIRGGDSYETAKSIEFNVEHKLDHHQKMREFDYFVFTLEPGEELNISLKTLEKGVRIRDAEVKENDNPYAGFQLHGSARNKIRSENIIGATHKTVSYSFMPSEKGTYYLLVGSTYAAMNKDHVTFILTKNSKGDLGTEKDAGNTVKTALKIEPKRYEANFIGGGDKRDLFAFTAKEGESYTIGIIPNEETNTYFKILVFDEYKQRLVNEMTGAGQGKKTKPFTIASEGTYYIDIQTGFSSRKSISYTLELKKAAP